MRASAYTPRQRRVVLLLVLLVAVVLALFAGFIITSMQGLEGLVVATPASGLTSDRSSSASPLPTATPTPVSTAMPEQGIWSQVRAARVFDQLAHQVELERGLAPRAEVPLSFLDEGDMAAALAQLYVERNSEAQLLPYVVLDLLSAGPVSVQPYAPAGVYVPEQELLYVAADGAQSDADAQWLLAHAYAHALLDQRFDLEAMALRAGTMDGKLAAEALIEGDATILTALYRYQTLSAVDWERMSEVIIQAESPGYGPPGGQDAGTDSDTWTRLHRFPHEAGRAFVQGLFEAGGWDAVNRAYIDPPRSTEQILHPSRYLEPQDGAAALAHDAAVLTDDAATLTDDAAALTDDAAALTDDAAALTDDAAAPRDDPASVVVPDIGRVLGDDWEMLVRETLGEFVTGLYMNQTLPESRAWEVADGWDGDTFVVWEGEDGGRVWVWRSIWDTSAEAAEFEQGLRTLIPQRYYPVRPVTGPRGLPGKWWEAKEGALQVCRAGRYVLFVRAPDVNTVVNLMEVLP